MLAESASIVNKVKPWTASQTSRVDPMLTILNLQLLAGLPIIEEALLARETLSKLNLIAVLSLFLKHSPGRTRSGLVVPSEPSLAGLAFPGIVGKLSIHNLCCCICV